MYKADEKFILIENKEYLEILQLLIRKINLSMSMFIDEYKFSEEDINSILIETDLNNMIINEMKEYHLLTMESISYCSICGDSVNICSCDEDYRDQYEKHYYRINQNNIIRLIIESINCIYQYNLEEEYSNSKYNFYKDNDIEIYIVKNKIDIDMISEISNGKGIIITIFEYLGKIDDYIFNWYDVLDIQRKDFFYDKFQNYIKNIRSSESFSFDLGDDFSVSDIENIRTILKNFFENKGYEYTTLERDYRPEYVDYGLPKEYIKGCFIKGDNKIFIKKIKELKIEVIYFKGGVIGEGIENFDLIKRFNTFILEKASIYRSIRIIEENTDRTNKIIKIGPILVNILTLIVTKFNSIDLFKDVTDKFSKSANVFLIVFIIINIAYIIFIFYYYIRPLSKRILFSWEKGIKKV